MSFQMTAFCIIANNYWPTDRNTDRCDPSNGACGDINDVYKSISSNIQSADWRLASSALLHFD